MRDGWIPVPATETPTLPAAIARFAGEKCRGEVATVLRRTELIPRQGSRCPTNSELPAAAIRDSVPSITHGRLASVSFSSYPICSPRSE